MWYQDNNNVNVPALPIEPVDNWDPGDGGIGQTPPNDIR